MTTTRTALVAFVLSLSLACGDDDDDGNIDDDCDVDLDDSDFEFDEQVCKGVELIVDCLDMRGVDADALTDAQLEPEIEACASMFEFCSVDPVRTHLPEGATMTELRGQTNMCVG